MKKILCNKLLFLIIISSISCNQEKEFYKNKKNDLARYKIRGPIKQVKETYYKVENKFEDFVKKYPPVWKEYKYFNDKGFISRCVRFGDGVSFFLGDDFFLEYEYDDSNRVIKTVSSYKIDKVKSANYENDPQGRVWLHENPSIDTFVYSNNSKSGYKIINDIPNQHTSWTEKYNNDGKITERTEFSDVGIPTQRTVYIYDDSSKLISEYVYNSNALISKTGYDYFPNKKVTIIQDSNFSVGKPAIKTEYFDSTGINIVKSFYDGSGHLYYPSYDEATYEYDSLGNTTKETGQSSSTIPSSISFGPRTSKHSYSDFDKYGNWRIKKSFEYNEVMGVYEQTGLTERIIEPNLGLIKQKENETLQNSGLYLLTAFTPFIFMLVFPAILSFLIVLLSIFWERNKFLTKFIVVFTGASSIILYVVTASIFYLIFKSYEFPRFGIDWFIKQIATMLFILTAISLGRVFQKNAKELKQSDAYASSSNILLFNYYADYSRAILGKISYTLLTYFIFLIFNFSVVNPYFNTIKEFMIKHF